MRSAACHFLFFLLFLVKPATIGTLYSRHVVNPLWQPATTAAEPTTDRWCVCCSRQCGQLTTTPRLLDDTT